MIKFDDLFKEHRALLGDAGRGDEFWVAHEAFKMRLRDALGDDDFIADLYASHLLRFISWCSTYRPYEPHTILSMLSSHSEIE